MWGTILSSQETLLQWSVVCGASLVAALLDIAWRRIPNLLTAPLCITGCLWAAAVGGLPAVGDAALACLLLAFPFVVLFVFAGGGAGDAKLMGAIGAWLGTAQGSIALIGVCSAGVLMGVCFALTRRRLRQTFRNISLVAQAVLLALVARGPVRGRVREIMSTLPKVEEMQTMPYGVAIFSGVALASLGVTCLCH